jgi:hypothetical protein
MRCALVTIHDANYKTLADLTWHRNRELYAARHGYDAIVQTENFKVANLGWAKIALLLEIMDRKEHDLLHWSGTDTMITNFTIPLTEFAYDGYHITISTDFNGIQNDSFLVRNTPEARGWLQMIMDKMPEFLSHPYLEQGVMMDTYQQYSDIIKVVPQRFINAYHYPLYQNKGAKGSLDRMGFSGQWQKGDFLIHCPDQKMDVRMNLFNQIINMVVI